MSDPIDPSGNPSGTQAGNPPRIVNWDVSAPEPWQSVPGPYGGPGLVLLECRRPAQPDVGAPEATLRVELIVGGGTVDDAEAMLTAPLPRRAGKVLRREAHRIDVPAGPAVLADTVIARRFGSQVQQLLDYVVVPAGTDERVSFAFSMPRIDSEAGLAAVGAVALESRDVVESLRLTLGGTTATDDGVAPA